MSTYTWLVNIELVSEDKTLCFFFFFFSGLREVGTRQQLIEFAERCSSYSYLCWYSNML